VACPGRPAAECLLDTSRSRIVPATARTRHAGIRWAARIHAPGCCAEGTAFSHEPGSTAHEQCVLRFSGVEPWLYGTTGGGSSPVYVPRQRWIAGGIGEAARRLGATGERSAIERIAWSFRWPLPFRQCATGGAGGSGGQGQRRLH